MIQFSIPVLVASLFFIARAGVSSLISFSEVDVLAVQSIMFYVLLSSLSVWYMVGASERIGKKGAFFLCSVYILFVLQQVGISVFIF